jgi:hypothetical protein
VTYNGETITIRVRKDKVSGIPVPQIWHHDERLVIEDIRPKEFC